MMVPTSRPQWSVKKRFFPILGIAWIGFISSAHVSNAEPQTFGIEFLPLATPGTAVTAPNSDYIVSAHTGSGEPQGAHWIRGKIVGKLDVSGHDKVTRLCFFKNPMATKHADSWAKTFGSGNPEPLRAITESGIVDCRFEKWVTRVGEKVLPLGLLSISFQKTIPAAGTPLINSNGDIVGLILQPSTELTAYAIPAQAVHRVQHDIANHHTLVRGWMGLSLSTESSIPRITRIWPDSPASKANLRENDILLKAGAYGTPHYPDAVNALFYVIPGQATRIEVMRGDKRITSTVTPTAKKPGN
jgi:PDZ domain